MKHEYGQKLLVPMLLKCYEHLHHISKALDSQSTQMDTNVVHFTKIDLMIWGWVVSVAPKSMANLIELEVNLAKVLKEEFEGAFEDEFDAHD